MNFLKKGFSLTEVLAALGIVAVIGAISIPPVVSGVQKNRIGSTLAHAVYQIELGCQNIIHEANVQSEKGSFTNVLQLITENDIGYSSSEASIVYNIEKILPKYCGLQEQDYTSDDILAIKNFNGSAGSVLFKSMILGAKKYFKFSKAPAEVAMSNFFGSGSVTENTDDTMALWVYVDVNGFRKTPNTFGKDIFLFLLRNDGKLEPYDSGTTGAEYTSKIVRDGFKVTYY